jgi:ubiquitin thioesterase protein OTUB1
MDRPSDEAILDQEWRIREEETRACPLVSPVLCSAALLEAYREDSVFRPKIEAVARDYPLLRRCRGDGNCFFRAAAFAWLLQPRVDVAGAERLLARAGYEGAVYGDFADAVRETLEALREPRDDSLQAYWTQNEGQSNAAVVLLRFLVAAELKSRATHYAPFLSQGEETLDAAGQVAAFCAAAVECMGVESDQIHIVALAAALGAAIEVVYVDGSADAAPERLSFTPDGAPGWTFTVLYRPGQRPIKLDEHAAVGGGRVVRQARLTRRLVLSGAALLAYAVARRDIAARRRRSAADGASGPAAFDERLAGLETARRGE